VNLRHAIAQNRFRQDLYYRLNILPITIPALRERGPDDIKALAAYFLKKNHPGCRLAPDALAQLAAHDWPGNVRELENTLQRAIHLSDGDMLSAEHLGLTRQNRPPLPPPSGSLREMEQRMIAATLQKTNSNMAETAKKLGISRATLYRKVKQYGIQAPLEN
jgi:transcriptional regulator with PAS, ATPase and Fis domain